MHILLVHTYTMLISNKFSRPERYKKKLVDACRAVECKIRIVFDGYSDHEHPKDPASNDCRYTRTPNEPATHYTYDHD